MAHVCVALSRLLDSDITDRKPLISRLTETFGVGSVECVPHDIELAVVENGQLLTLTSCRMLKAACAGTAERLPSCNT